MGMTPEGRVKNAIKKYLKTNNIWFYMPVSNGMGRVGCPDFLVCYYGVFVAFEAKAPGKSNTVTPNQEREINSIRESHGQAYVVESVDAVVEILRRVAGNERLREESL